MDEVIEIMSSSPDYRNSRTVVPSRPRPKLKPEERRPVLRNDPDVIELTDSDSDFNYASPIKRKHVATSPKAGPSRQSTQRTGLRREDFLSRVSGSYQTGSSSAGVTSRGSVDPSPPKKSKSKAMPLFLPSDEDYQLDVDADPLPTNTATTNPPPASAGVTRRGSIDPSPRKNSNSKAMPLFLPSDEDHQLDVDADPLPTTTAKTSPPPAVIDPIDTYVAQILEIVPDVQLEHLRALIDEHLPTYAHAVVEPILHILFEDPKYPKVDKKGKRKRVEDDQAGRERGQPKGKVDLGNKDRKGEGGPEYINIAIDQLLIDFPYIPKPHIRKIFFANNGLYAPTYLFLDDEKKQPNLPYAVKTVASRVSGKRKAVNDPEFDKEREWILLKLQEDAAENDAQVAEDLNEQEYEECGDGIECGCCFSSYPFDKMIQCPEAHLFCHSCMKSYASNLLGSHDPNIICMDQSGCKLLFTESELKRFLTPKLMALYDRVKQRKDIEAAGLEGLEECPFCEYKVVIENENEKLFRCENEECGAVSCRGCKKADHLPKSCKEMEEDKHLDGRHAVEEAMTRALMRNCPKCGKAFIKEYGCNKMMCPGCHTMSCYVCRKVITDYNHFANTPGQSNKCQLSDLTEAQRHKEVSEAANKALAEYKEQHPDAEDKDIKVDLPAPPPRPAPGYAVQYPYYGHPAPVDPAYFNVNVNINGMVALPPMIQPPRIPVAVPRKNRRRR